MAFLDDLIFPETLALGGSGGPMWMTELVISPGGHETRNQRWSTSRAEYEIGLSNRTLAETQQLLALAYLTKGRALGFRFKDVVSQDFQAVDSPVGTGTGSSATYQTSKRYSIGSLTYDRPIYKLIAVQAVKVNGVATGSYSINLNTGVLTITATNGHAITMSYTFHVPVRLDFDSTKIQRGPDLNTFQWPSVRLLETRDIS